MGLHCQFGEVHLFGNIQYGIQYRQATHIRGTTVHIFSMEMWLTKLSWGRIRGSNGSMPDFFLEAVFQGHVPGQSLPDEATGGADKHRDFFYYRSPLHACEKSYFSAAIPSSELMFNRVSPNW